MAQEAQEDDRLDPLGHAKSHEYIGTFMEQPQGLSMVNSVQIVHPYTLVTLATYLLTCSLLLRHRTE
jgi:hypothetical protein